MTGLDFELRLNISGKQDFNSHVDTYFCKTKALPSFVFMVLIIRLDFFKQFCSPENTKHAKDVNLNLSSLITQPPLKPMVTMKRI